MKRSYVFSAATLIVSLMAFSTASAEISEKRVEYSQGGSKLIGFEYFDTAAKTKAPGVLVFSDWMGISDFSKERGRELAKAGYRAFVADIYGDGKLAADPKEAGALATKFKSDRPLFRARGQAALDTLLKDPLVDPKRVGAIGFCFGGTAALELARTGAPLAGLVSFHGGLETPDKTLAKNIKGRVLVLHGADDPFVKPEEVAAFEEEMRNGGVTWELTKYSNAVHAFTNPAAGTDNSKGAAYNQLAATRSFKAMWGFFAELWK